MNWEAIGAVAEVLGAIAVVATLYYLAVQFRETRYQTLANNTTHAVDRWLQAQVKMLETNDSVSLVRSGLNSYESLSPDEKGRFTGYMFELNAAYQAVLNLNEQGLLDSRQFSAMEAAMAAHMKCPGAKMWWDDVNHHLPEHIRDKINQIVTDYKGPAFTEQLSFYHSSINGQTNLNDT